MKEKNPHVLRAACSPASVQIALHTHAQGKARTQRRKHKTKRKAEDFSPFSQSTRSIPRGDNSTVNACSDNSSAGRGCSTASVQIALMHLHQPSVPPLQTHSSLSQCSLPHLPYQMPYCCAHQKEEGDYSALQDAYPAVTAQPAPFTCV